MASVSAPPALAPAPQVSPPPTTASPSPGVVGSVTSKEWVIPPRPKPGRKPATDTPPTKRKAQNRAAQRAFRERRAARVNELEEQIKQMEEDFDRKELEYKNQIAELNRELNQCKDEITWWKNRCHALEQDLFQQKASSQTAQRDESGAGTHDAMLSGSRTSGNSSSNSAPTNDSGSRQTSSCCGPTTKCPCQEDAIQISNLVNNNESTPRRRSNEKPVLEASERQKPEPTIKEEPEPMEIDFTTRFSSSRPSSVLEIRAPSTPPADRCGFCREGTACICAEMNDQSPGADLSESVPLAPARNLSLFTPPPSDGDDRDVTLPPIKEASNPCANGPGTCAQCLEDPKRMLFCKTLAASGLKEGPSNGCCGGNNGCRRSNSGSVKPLTVTCSDAYTALSRHPKFSQASDDLTSWLPKLHALPKPVKDNIRGRPAIEVEAASVMNVLRYFDRRFASK
ncbi:hypothetical protein VTN31DRAFT_4969 [Thermomyces dupontii]|uniref:uncharacterized protein n=1 Tax=Talaromyces thermophilus TaxID=28565 RepID=UPI003742FF0D